MKNPSFGEFCMVGLLGIAGGGPETASPRRLADRGLVEELFQALVGAVLPDDDYDNATLNSSHATHANTRVSSTQGDRRWVTWPVLAADEKNARHPCWHLTFAMTPTVRSA